MSTIKKINELANEIESKLVSKAYQDGDIIEMNYLEISTMLYRLAGSLQYKAIKSKDLEKGEKLRQVAALLDQAHTILRNLYW